MMAGSHVALGAAAWLVTAPWLGLSPTSPLGIGLAVGAALLPDIDHPKSWFGRRTRPVSTLVAAILGHRGITHSLLAVLLCGWLMWRDGMPRDWIAPVAVGYLSHLLADLLTPGGLRLLWPLRGTWSLPLCRTGSPMEPMIVSLILAWAWCGVGGGADAARAWRWLDSCRVETGRLSCGEVEETPLPLPPPPAPPRRLAAARGPVVR